MRWTPGARLGQEPPRAAPPLSPPRTPPSLRLAESRPPGRAEQRDRAWGTLGCSPASWSPGILALGKKGGITPAELVISSDCKDTVFQSSCYRNSLSLPAVCNQRASGPSSCPVADSEPGRSPRLWCARRDAAEAMPSEEPAPTLGDSSGRDGAAAQGGPCPGRLGAPYAEAWGYFHLAPARPGHLAGRWATCRLCGEQVGRGPGLQAGTSALWRHLKGAHRRELEGGGAWRGLGNCGAPGPAAAAEREWARLREQMGALAEQGLRRERELARREAAVARGERALERGRSALRALERRLRAEREALQARLRELGWPAAGTPGKEDPGDGMGDTCVAAEVLL